MNEVQTSAVENEERGWPIPADLRRRLLAVLLEDEEHPSRAMSYEAFLEWADEDTYAEWVNGKVIMTSPASQLHQRLVSFLDQFLGLYVYYRGLGRILTAPFQMKLPHSGREPDVLFVARAHLERLRTNYLDGPADLVVEVVSPESTGRDRGEKFYEYEAAGVPEYWLLDPQTRRAEFYRLDEEGRYQLIPLEEGRYVSVQLPGLWLRVDWLWQEEPPSPLRALAEVLDVAPSLLEQFENALRGG